MTMEYLIEVCVEPSVSTTERGQLLERFAGRFMESQGYEVKEQVRLTGMEVDLLCREKINSEIVLVECKAHRSSVSAKAIQSLFGNVSMNDYASGWLISTYALGKEVKGIQHEWSQKPEERRRKLRIYSPDVLIERLIDAHIIVDPEKRCVIPRGLCRGDEAFLLLTQRGEYWAIPFVDKNTGLMVSAALYKADTGDFIREPSVTAWLVETDTSLRSLTWITEEATSSVNVKLEEELQNIVGVPMADHWADYRPSRPIDFVGRERIQKSLFDFLDGVRERKTSTRLVALKGPSGWGKSSCVLKIADSARNKRNKSKYFVFAVDSRAAITKRFPELALVSTIKAAIAAGFVEATRELSFGSTGNFFGTLGMKTLTHALASQHKVICVFFDQFEELLYKEELVEVFQEMRRLCTSIEEAQENVVIGFSWKTDGTITTEHGAYHLWHDLSDHRVELDLPPFSDREVSLAIGRFGKELGQPIGTQLRRLLEDHCQGFPWLLKKLCVHILELVRAGAHQSDILAKNLNIISLFKRDLEKLTSAEVGCIQYVARDTPAEIFKTIQTFGDAVVTSLLNKRLIIRSGTRLTIYWDIFRDYILSEKIPYIPITYTPQSNLQSYMRALKWLTTRKQATYEELASAMGVTVPSADNLVRDLVNLGHVEASRNAGILRPLYHSEEEAFDVVFEFWKSHEIVRRIASEVGIAVELTEQQYFRIFSSIYQRSGYLPKTLSVYANRTLSWLLYLGFLESVSSGFKLHNLGRRAPTSPLPKSDTRRKAALFVADAPPTSVVTAFADRLANGKTRAELEALHGRNAIAALFSLGLAQVRGGKVYFSECSGDRERLVKDAALRTPTIISVQKILKDDPYINGRKLGEKLAAEMGISWAPGSQNRYGTALRQWAKWASGKYRSKQADLFTDEERC